MTAMGRPPKFTVDAMLDAAAGLLVEEGPRALSASAVASRIDAPSGSVYHRFPSRDHLAAALWLRTLERFDRDVVSLMATPGDAREVAVGTALAVIGWCEANPREAHILAGSRLEDLLTGDLPEALKNRAAALRQSQRTATASFADRLGVPLDLAALAVAGIPLAAVRPHLSPSTSIPEWVPDAVERAVRGVLPQRLENA